MLLAVALLSLGGSACGGTGRSMTSTGASSALTTNASPADSTTNTASTEDYTKVDKDKDNDVTAPYDDKANPELVYGHTASATDRRAVTKLIKQFYTSAAVGDGTKACSMLLSSIVEAIVEDYGHGSAGPAYLSSGTNCPAIMGLLFKHFHTQLTAELPRLRVTHVRLVEHHGLAILSFGRLPERQIPVGREGHSWKVKALLDNELS